MDKISERKYEIANRKVEIRSLLEGTEEVNLDELETELRNLDTELADLEKRSAIVGTLKTVEKPEMRKDNVMDKNITYGVDSAEYRSAFLKNLQGKELTIEERSAINAASVIPTQTMNSIIEKLEQTSILYPYITTSSISGNLSLPVENVKNDASWVAMSTANADGDDSFDSIDLAAYKLIKTIEIGADVSVMGIDAFETFLVNALTKKMAKAVDNSIINGTGSNQPTGLAHSGQITNTGKFTKTGMTFDDLVAIIADLPSSEYRVNAKFVMSSALYFGDVVPALAAEGVGVDMQVALKNKILGYDVILDDYMPVDTMIFGDLSYYHFNWAQNITVESDKSVGFRTGSTVYRAMALADGKPTLPEAFNKYTRATA